MQTPHTVPKMARHAPSVCVDPCRTTVSFHLPFRLLHSKPISWATGQIISPFKSPCADLWRVEDKTQTITKEAFNAAPVLDQTLSSPDALTMETGRGTGLTLTKVARRLSSSRFLGQEESLCRAFPSLGGSPYTTSPVTCLQSFYFLFRD